MSLMSLHRYALFFFLSRKNKRFPLKTHTRFHCLGCMAIRFCSTGSHGSYIRLYFVRQRLFYFGGKRWSSQSWVSHIFERNSAVCPVVQPWKILKRGSQGSWWTYRQVVVLFHMLFIANALLLIKESLLELKSALITEESLIYCVTSSIL